MSTASATAVGSPARRPATTGGSGGGNRSANQPSLGPRKNNANDFYFGKIIGEGKRDAKLTYPYFAAFS